MSEKGGEKVSEKVNQKVSKQEVVRQTKIKRMSAFARCQTRRKKGIEFMKKLTRKKIIKITEGNYSNSNMIKKHF